MKSRRWTEACSRAREALGELLDLQYEYDDWRNSLPEELQGSPFSETLDAACNLDLQGALDTVEKAGNLLEDEAYLYILEAKAKLEKATRRKRHLLLEDWRIGM